MDGDEFENFMANVLAQKGYQVQTTPKSGDQGVDLLLTINERNVAVQLKRYTGAVGNEAYNLSSYPHLSCKSATFSSRGGGTRTHTVRILSPLPLPIGLRPRAPR
jgi:restriction system protein